MTHPASRQAVRRGPACGDVASAPRRGEEDAHTTSMTAGGDRAEDRHAA